MTILQAILLGIVQGLTEFLPISSSAHLVIVPYLLGWQIPPAEAFVFDVLVQVATLVAVIAYFWQDLVKILRAFLLGLWQKRPLQDSDSRLGWLILAASLPAGVIGLLLKDAVEMAFASALVTALFLLLTPALLVIAERIGRRDRDIQELSWIDALWIGFFQAMAIFPGLSRSGATITGGMTRHLQRPAAARFSFLMSIPVMLAAGLVAALDLLQLPHIGQSASQSLPSLIVTFAAGFVAAAVVGYLSIRWLLGYLTRHPLYGFAIYCAALSLLVLGVYLLRL